jgi:hypothetical protein
MSSSKLVSKVETMELLVDPISLLLLVFCEVPEFE